jgi:mono/diheme cytochrome c family protein
MTKRSRNAILLGAAALPVLAFSFGGWAVITVDDLPDYAVAGSPMTLSFAVRQHGRTLLGDLKPEVVAKGSGGEIRAAASAASGDRYTASLTIPKAGDWTVTIKSGFLAIDMTLVPIKVIDRGAPAPRALADAERGFRLFVAKGCVTCHSLEETSAWKSANNVGPVLTGRRYVPEVLADFLAEPEKSPLARNTQSEIRMPNLGLKQREISALVAFINSTGQAAKTPTRR